VKSGVVDLSFGRLQIEDQARAGLRDVSTGGHIVTNNQGVKRAPQSPSPWPKMRSASVTENDRRIVPDRMKWRWSRFGCDLKPRPSPIVQDSG